MCQSAAGAHHGEPGGPKTPILSVIIPTFNQVDLLRKCLMSVRQTGLIDLEVIVVDDGSTDETQSVVRAEFPGVRYLWQPNSGNPSQPRNAGFQAARGRYVAFLDGDDQWLPGMPARAIDLLERHPRFGLLFADSWVGNATSGFQSWMRRPELASFWRLSHQPLEPGLFACPRRAFFRQLATCNVIFIGSTIIRREVFASSGGFDSAYWGGEDWEVWMRLAATIECAFWNEAMSIYTMHDGNVTKKRDLMIGGFAQALRNVLADAALEPGERRHTRQRLRQQLFYHAYLAYDRGDITEARKRFSVAIRAGRRDPLTLACAAMCQLPPQLVSWVRRRKQGLGL